MNSVVYPAEEPPPPYSPYPTPPGTLFNILDLTIYLYIYM